MRLPVWILAAALLCGAAVVSDASAGAGDASFALKPVLYDPALAATKSYFVLAVKPGAVVHDRIRLVNTGGRTGTAYLYPVDATTGQTSGAVYLSRQSPRRDVGAWISLSRSRVTLAPGANAIVDFTIRVPRTARPGDHLGAVVAENSQVQRSTGHGALQIRIRHLTIDAVEVELPGTPVARVVPTGVKAGGQHGYQYVYVHLKSTGTVLVRPNASVVIRNAGGRVVARRSFQLDTFVPHTAIDYPVLLPRQVLPPGAYTADVRLFSSANRVLGYRKTQPAPFDVTRRFRFGVSSGERTQVFSGAAPVASPGAGPTAGHSSASRKLLVGIVVVLALLVAVILGVLLLLLRRSRRAKAASSGAAPAAEATAEAVAAPEDHEEPGWAGLLAAYQSEPRHRNGWQENDSLEELVPAVATQAPLEPEPEPEREPEPEPEFEPVVDYAPVGEYEPEPAFAPEPAPEPIPADPSQQPAVLDPDELKELIVRHDLAVADAYFRSFPVDEDPAGPAVPKPAPRREPASQPVSEPTPVQRPVQPAHRDADVHNLSSALLDASLIALAAVVASRLLKSDS